jgi:hypothetical protein
LKNARLPPRHRLAAWFAEGTICGIGIDTGR